MSGAIVIKTPISQGGAITGETREVARCTDLWIPYSLATEVVMKATGAANMQHYAGAMSTRVESAVMNLQGWQVHGRNPGDTIEVIAGRFVTPMDMPQRVPAGAIPPVVRGNMNDIQNILPHVLLRMLGGKVQILPEDIEAAFGHGIMTHVVQDPTYYTAELI